MINGNNDYWQNSGMNMRKDNDEWVAAPETCSGGGSSALLIEKSITENGDYSAKDDNADGYSEVAVDVGSNFLKVTVPGLPEKLTQGYPKAEAYTNVDNPKKLSIYTSKTGEYHIDTRDVYVICVDPVVSIEGFYDDAYDCYVVFTPSENYQGLYNKYTTPGVGSPIEFTGDAVVPGDGKIYIAYVRYISTTYGAKRIMKKYDINFYHTIE